MSDLLTLVVTGLVSGAIYSLIATCLVVSYRTTGIFNLGYGAIAFVSAFVYYIAHTGGGWPVLPAAIFAIGVVGPLLGWGLDRLIFRKLADADESAKLVATVGVLVFVPALAYLVEQVINDLGGHLVDTSQVEGAPGIGPNPLVTWHMGSVPVTSDQVVVLGLAVVSGVGMWFLLNRTRTGLEMRAVVNRPNLASLRGVSRQRTSLTAWVIGATLAAAAGVVASPIFNQLTPGTFDDIMFVAIAAVVVGGFRSVPITFAAGLALGVVQEITVRYATFAQSINGFADAVPFAVILIGLAVRRGVRVRAAGALSDTRAEPDWTSDLSRFRRALPWGIAAALLFIYTAFVADQFWVGEVSLGLALAVVMLSFVVITGLGGLVSLAQAAFVVVAGLTAGIAIQQYHVPYFPALLLGIAVCALLSLAVSLPSVRLGGLAFALATLALGFLADNVLFEWNWFTNTSDGWLFQPPRIAGLDFADGKTFAVGLFVCVGVVLVLVRNLERSSSGRAAIAVNTSEAGRPHVWHQPVQHQGLHHLRQRVDRRLRRHPAGHAGSLRRRAGLHHPDQPAVAGRHRAAGRAQARRGRHRGPRRGAGAGRHPGRIPLRFR